MPRGRKVGYRKPNAKRFQLMVRVEYHERAWVEACAKLNKMSMSNYIRMMLRLGMERKPVL